MVKIPILNCLMVLLKKKIMKKLMLLILIVLFLIFQNIKLRNTSYPKFTERQINWLFERLKNTQISIKNRIDLRVEINSRLIKPFLILIISTLICFLLFTNNDKINLKKLKIIIYIILCKPFNY